MRIYEERTKMSERKSKEFWVLDNDEMPVKATGYECPPNDDVWWFPSLRFSTAGVYESQEAAEAAAFKKAQRDLKAVQGRLTRLGVKL
jgi:hypothetical protein